MKIISLKKLIFIIVLIYGIIGINNKSYAEADFSYKVVKNSNAGPTTNVSEYEICTDALMYHISANGYDKKIGDTCDDNFQAVGVGSSNSLKAKGYGWYTYKLKSLQGLIEYCHSKNPTVTNDKSNITIGTEPYTVDYNYEILVNLSESSLSKTSKDVMKRFWEGMYSAIQNEFIEYQDSYFFRENTLKAIDKIRGTLNSEGLEANNLSERNLSRNRTDYSAQSKKEYLTLLTTYMYSINREEKLASVGKGDLVPFLYYAEHTGETDPYIIGKYAYVALVYEFLRVSGTNYWTAEFDRIYFNNTGFADSEIFEEYDIETLEQWYDETYEKYKNDRGVKQNPLIGSDIDTIISSNYTINYQVDATKDYIENIYAELGIDMTVDDFISKNALMAEYMMQNSNFDDVIKDYNVSIKFVVDNLQRGTFEEKNGTTAVLSDFQTIEFDDTIEKVGSLDKDNDTLTNKAELGEVKWQDITGFVEKMYQSKYGTNMAMYESKVDEMVINNGGYTDFYGNFVFGHVKKEKDLLGNIKVFYRVYDYKSNPVLKDTDFDGMDDAADSRPKDNKFQGMAKIERNQNLKVDYHNDYRHFFIDNNKYNSELAEMSLMISNLANDEDRNLNIYQGGTQVGMMNIGGLHIGDMNVTRYLSKVGFIPLTTMSLSNGKAYLSYKIVNYYGKEKIIFGIFIGGFDDEESYIKFITDTNNMHQNYEEIVNSIVNKIDSLKNIDLIKQYFNSRNYCYFITGKGIGGAVAAEVATKLGDMHNIYCYTFGMPNIKSSPTLSYIKNIVNEDDLLIKIHSDIGQDGDAYNKSIYWDLIPEYRHYVESPNRYKGNYKKTNTIRNNLEDIKRMISSERYDSFISDEAKYLYSQIGGRIAFDSYEIFNHIRDNVNNGMEERLVEIEEFTDSLTTANSTKAYWCLVKVLDGYDSKYYYGEENKLYNETMVSAFNGSEITTDDNTPKDKRDGYYFNHYDDMDVDYNNSDEETVRIKDFMYSNYTLDTDDSKDINYVKFWYEGNENKPLVLKTGNTDRIESLFEYKAGDMHQNTLCTYGSYRNKKWIDLYKGSKNTTAISLGNNNYLVSINNRILAAFPAALFSEDFSNTKNEFHKSTENMNMVTNYNEPNDTGKDEGKYKGASIVGKDKDMYRLVDVVIEDENEQQFVVPFICIDAKSVHLLPNYDLANKKGMFSIFTDNRYGQVMEQITDSNPVTYNYYKYRINLWNQEIWFPEDMALVAEQDIINGINTYTNLGKMIKYYDKDDARIVNHISPIEPYINIGGSNTGLNNIITSVICGKGVSTQKPNCRIVSMRVYDEKCADINGNVDTSGTWGNRQEEIDETSTYKLLNVLSDGYTSIYDYYNDNKFKKIVRY